MKKIFTIFGLTAALLVVTVLPALAGNGAPPAAGCQPGADNGIIEGWQMLNLEEFAQFLVDDFSYPDYGIALARATATFAFCDHNGDNYICVMEQNFPNDSSGSNHWWLAEDNHLFGGQ